MLKRVHYFVVEGVRTVKVPTHRRVCHHHSSSGTEKTLVFHSELKNERNNYPATSVAGSVRMNPKDRVYPGMCETQNLIKYQ